MIKELSKIIATHDGVVIASISGRHYAMDRDGHWDRTEQVFRILTKPDQKIEPVEAVLEKAYAKNLSDEFVIPTATNGPYPIKNDDAVIFFNFREDSMRQITEPFLNTSFNRFDILPIKNLAVTTMTSYQESSSAKVAFFRETINNPLGKILSDNKKNQLRIAETDKYAHVTYFFNGLREDPFPNEYRVLIPSWNVVHQDEKPEMRAEEITDRILIALNEGSFDFILANYANPDVVAHTGNFEATVKAVRAVDRTLERLSRAIIAYGHVLVITADHGNAEVLMGPMSGKTETKHNTNPVPIYIVAKELQRKEPGKPISTLENVGLLSDVAPTILELMHIPKPPEMTGQSLLDQLLYH
ncbi:phosphoglycerate mutase (2,3-diphosphoglycerate-independent) [Candidatus Peregrinibacteria bacterium]|nr:phosphoglycerate mutase (2,3-diphosphoglycerate-independent) [Candidatus Peregrinibacteria bacterium]